ncbi:MAG: CapA family protein [Deltaproteobacteria bacterium]|nr:CapA family protein [Deltaproteobacteria bacterium]
MATKALRSAVFALILTLPSLAFADEIKIICVGDVMLSRHIGKVIAARGDKFPFERIKTTLAQGDVVFGNLESVLGDKDDKIQFPDKPFNFIAPLSMAKTLKDAGFTVMGLANNHAMDYGGGALAKTKIALDAKGIKSFGAGADIDAARTPAIVEIKGVKFAFLGYGIGHSSDIYAAAKRPGVAPVNSPIIAKDVKAARAKADVVIVSLHWGAEYENTPTDKQRETAHKIIDAGADLLIGHHPHVMQGIEIYKDKIIAYSLGNFLFDQKGKGTDRGFILVINYDGKNLKSASVIPLDRFLSFYPKPAEGEIKKEILDELKRITGTVNSDAGFLKKLGLD